MIKRKIEREKNGMPLIRRCENCKWYGCFWGYECKVRREFIYHPIIKAKFCKYYEAEKGSGT